jgi:porin
MSKTLREILLAALLLTHGVAFAVEEWQEGALSGESQRLRRSWGEAGIHTELLYKGNWLSSSLGDAKHGSDYMQNLELKVGLDVEKMWEIPNSTAFIHVIHNSGGKMNAAYLHSIMGVDNSEATDNNSKLYQAWISKTFYHSALSVLAGIYPIDTEFYVTDTSGIFLNPSFGMAAEVTQTGRNGPSIYPLAALGVRVKYQPTPVFYVQAAVLDGNPGGGRNPHWTRFNPFHGDGLLQLAEIAFQPGEAHHMQEYIDPLKGVILTEGQKLESRYEPIGKYAIGHWSYSKPFDDLLYNDLAGNPLQHRNQGSYLLMENSVYRAEDMQRDAVAFFRYGTADGHVNIFDYSDSFGVRIRGLIAGRADDFFGIAVSHAHASESYRLARKALAMPHNETSIEATYRAQLKAWLVMQANVQYISNPGLVPGVRNATVFGLRCEIAI